MIVFELGFILFVLGLASTTRTSRSTTAGTWSGPAPARRRARRTTRSSSRGTTRSGRRRSSTRRSPSRCSSLPWLPPFLWWAIPIALLVFCMTRHRPPLWAWALTLACFCWLSSLGVYVFGNPGMWIVAFVAAGTVLVLAVRAGPAQAHVRADRPARGEPSVVVDRARRDGGGLAACSGRSGADWVTVLRNSDVDPRLQLPDHPADGRAADPWLLDPRHPIHGWIAPPARSPEPCSGLTAPAQRIDGQRLWSGWPTSSSVSAASPADRPEHRDQRDERDHRRARRGSIDRHRAAAAPAAARRTARFAASATANSAQAASSTRPLIAISRNTNAA